MKPCVVRSDALILNLRGAAAGAVSMATWSPCFLSCSLNSASLTSRTDHGATFKFARMSLDHRSGWGHLVTAREYDNPSSAPRVYWLESRM